MLIQNLAGTAHPPCAGWLVASYRGSLLEVSFMGQVSWDGGFFSGFLEGGSSQKCTSAPFLSREVEGWNKSLKWMHHVIWDFFFSCAAQQTVDWVEHSCCWCWWEKCARLSALPCGWASLHQPLYTENTGKVQLLFFPLRPRSLVPWPGIKPTPPPMEAWSPNSWTTRVFPQLHIFACFLCRYKITLCFFFFLFYVTSFNSPYIQSADLRIIVTLLEYF